MPVLDERNRLAIGRQRQLQGPELDVRQAPDLALFRIKDKHTRGLAQIGREDQIATVRSPPDVMDDRVLQAEPGAHANLLPLVMVHRVKPLRTVYVQQNRNRIPRRGRHNFLDPGPLEVGEGLRSLILNDRPAVDVILRDQLHPDERPVLGFGVYPIEAPPHIVPVQVYHQRIFVQPVGTPVFVARLPGDATSTRKRTPAIQVLPILSSERRPEILADAIGSPPEATPQPDAKPEKRNLAVESGRPLIKRRARGIFLPGLRLKSVAPANIEPVDQLRVGGRSQHLGERPGIVR